MASRFHPLGTDRRGRDMLAASILGSRWAVLPGLCMMILACLLGAVSGAVQGFYRNRSAAVLGWTGILIESIPLLLPLFLASLLFRFNPFLVMMVLGVLWAPRVAHQVRDRVQHLVRLQFVEAERELGVTEPAILWRDIVWHNTRGLLASQFFYGMGFAVLIEVTLSYLQLGVDDVSWGRLLFEARTDLSTGEVYWTSVVPLLALAGSVLGYFALGKHLVRTDRA